MYYSRTVLVAFFFCIKNKIIDHCVTLNCGLRNDHFFPSTHPTIQKLNKRTVTRQVCCHSATLGVCAAEQQQNCSSICSQWVKHVVQHSSREDTTEQIIMIQNIVTPWTRATPRPSVLFPWTAGHLCFCVCACVC